MTWTPMWDRDGERCVLVLEGTRADRLQLLQGQTVVLELPVKTVAQAERLARWWHVLCAAPSTSAA